MCNRLTMWIGLLILVHLIGANLAVAQPEKRRMIFLEVSADARAMVGTQQEWLRMLQEVGADRVMSKTSSSGTPAVEETETSVSTVVKVTGVISGNKLVLPGGSFSIRDTAAIRALLQKLRDDGARVALAEKKAFGLTSEQLVDLHTRFAETVEFQTAGQNAGDIVGKLVGKTGLRFELDSAARAALSGEETVREEFKGISIGTALAAVVRPLGLVVEPKREQGKSLIVHLLDSRDSQEHWPIGWPIEKPPVIVEPKLFTKIPIEIQNYPLKSVLDALEKRAGSPFFYDHNTLAREGIELDEVKVSLVQKQITLMGAVSKVLQQTKPKLSYEIRLDESGKPFLWISIR